MMHPFLSTKVATAPGTAATSGDGAPAPGTDPFVPIEDLLADDPNGVALKRLKEELALLSTRVRRAMDKGLGPADFRRHEALLFAIRTAGDVVEAVWEKQNASR